MATDWRERITADPAILVGKPVVRGTRLAVESVPELVAGGWSFAEVLASYPVLTVEDIRACVAYAKVVLAEQRAVAALTARVDWAGHSSVIEDDRVRMRSLVAVGLVE